MLGEFERLADKEPETYAKIWENFGAVLKEGIYEDFERRDALLALARFKTTASAASWRSLEGLRRRAQGQPDRDLLSRRRRHARGLKSSPHLEGFRARGIEVLLLSDPVDSFWVMPARRSTASHSSR